MEVVLIHKPISPISPEVMPAMIDMAKRLNADPGAFVPGGKQIASYFAHAEWAIFCVWEVPDVEALMPLAEQIRMFGWNTEVILVDNVEVAIEKASKALEAVRQ